MKSGLQLRGRVCYIAACAIMASAFCTSALHAADSEVPVNWNVAPMRSGAYLESFESALPAWAGRTGGSSVTATFPALNALPARSNVWFDTSAKVMQIATDGSVLTNSLLNSESGAINFASDPIYIDARVRFDALAEAPEAELLADCKLAFYVNSDRKLVVVHNGGTTVSSSELDTNKWYQVTAKLLNSKCDIKLNDETILSDLALSASGIANQLDAINLYGTGYMDELYVSYGAPDYAVAGPTTSIPALPADGSNVPGDEEQTRINRWLSEQSGLTGLGMTQDQLSAAYLADAALTGEAAPVACVLGISAIDIVTPTNLKVTAKLTVAGNGKSGPINGRIQLLGKVNQSDAEWTALEGAISPNQADFTNGEAVYFYTIPVGGYKFFKPTIIP